MKSIRMAGLFALLAFPVRAGVSLSWEIHILEVEIVSCTGPSIRNIRLLPRAEDVTDEQALAALPLGHMIRARILRSRVIEEFLGGVWPPKLHDWKRQDVRQPTAFFPPVHVPAAALPEDLVWPVCRNLRAGSRRLMFVTTGTDCDTTGRMDLCVFSPSRILYDMTDDVRGYVGHERPNSP